MSDAFNKLAAKTLWSSQRRDSSIQGPDEAWNSGYDSGIDTGLEEVQRLQDKIAALRVELDNAVNQQHIDLEKLQAALEDNARLKAVNEMSQMEIDRLKIKIVVDRLSQ